MNSVPAGILQFKQKLWEAILAGSVPSLEAVIWEIITAEVHSGRCCFRKALLLSLDGSDFASEAHRNELLQRFAAQSGAGDTDAQCFIGILLCFQGGHDASEFVMPAHGVKFLHAAAERHNNLATLLLALCFECGKGVEVSTDAAKQCYNMAATRGYQMAQIFLKELVRDTTFASQQAVHQQQQLQQIQGNLQAGHLSTNLLGTLGGNMPGSLQLGGPSSLQANKQLPPHSLQAGGQPLHSAAGLHLSQLGSLGSLSDGRGGINLEQTEQQVLLARKRLQAAVQEKNVGALATAVEWAQEVSNLTGQMIPELPRARTILAYCRENHAFPDIPSTLSRGPSPAPSQRSNAPSAAGITVPASPASQADRRPGSALPGEVSSEEKPSSKGSNKLRGSNEPTAAEKGEAFFHQGPSHLDVSLEPLEQDVETTPSEQPMPTDINLDDLGSDTAEVTPQGELPLSQSLHNDQLHSPAVAIPKKGTSNHGSIGDRRQVVTGSVADSEPPLTKQALDLFNVTGGPAASRSAPNSHRDACERLSVASLASLQPGKEATSDGGKEGHEAEGSLKDEAHVGRSASVRAPSPSGQGEADVRRAQSAMGVREDELQGPTRVEELKLADLKVSKGEGSAVDSVVSAEDLAILASRGVSIAALKTAFLSTTDPEKLEAYARGLRQILDSSNGRVPQGGLAGPPTTSPFSAASTQGVQTSAPAQPNSSAPQQQDWGKLMQALHANMTGLEGEPLNDYLHNLRVLCSEDPSNDMITPPSQAVPGIEAILGALQAQGTTPQQQQEFLQAAVLAARNQNQAQLGNMQGFNQQQARLLQQTQGLPLHLQGLGTELASRFPAGLGQNAFNTSQGLNNGAMGYSQGLNNLGARRYNQPVNLQGGNFGQAHDITHLLDPSNQGLGSRLSAGNVNPRAGLSGGLPPQIGSQGSGSGLPPNHDNLWTMYGNKPGATNLANPGLLGTSTAGLRTNLRFAPGLANKQLPPDLHQSMLTQSNLQANNGLSLGRANLNGGVGSWNSSMGANSRLGNPALGNPVLGTPALGSQGLGSQTLGGVMGNSTSLGWASLQGFPGNGSQGLQPNSGMPGLGGGAGIQGLQRNQRLQGGIPNSSALQSLRLNQTQTPQPIGPQSSSQPLRTDQQPNTYSLFRAPSNSMPGAATAAGMSLQGSPSQQTLAENLWGNQANASASQSMSTPFAADNQGSKPLHASLASGASATVGDASLDIGSASSGILNKDLAGQPDKKPWGSSNALSASQGLYPQPLGPADPPTLSGWNSTEALQQLQGQGKQAQFVGIGGEDSLAQAFRQKPPRPSALSQPQSRPLAQPHSIHNLGTSLGVDNFGSSLGTGLVGSNSNLSGMGNSGGLGSLAPNGVSPGLGQNIAALGGLNNLGRLPQNLLSHPQQPRPSRFPNQGF